MTLVPIFRRASTAFILAAGMSAAVAASAKIEYNRDVRPILSENCFPCHGPDSASRKGNLRLDHFENAIAPRKDSQPAIVPGKPAQSELVHRINATDPDDIMPPTKTHKVLKRSEKELLAKWIAEGAKYEPHWSLIAPKRPALPKVHNTRWVRNPIDYFVVARLEQARLKPAPEADRRTLIRRVSLDLTGLPPSPEEVENFVADKSPDAYEKVVDRLLASPRWGEHRGRYWLDAARYGDTHGIHIDNFREIWSYRDWVINALNANMPFDQFTLEQLAGDLLPNATLDQKIASGFNRCNITTSEGGAIDEEYLVLYARDRTETTSQVWLGLTTGCAVCHDHKFDPLPQKEFYSLSAFFNNTTQKAMDGNVKDTPPIVVVPAAGDRADWEKLSGERKAGQKRMDGRKEVARADFNAWLTNASAAELSARVPKEKLVTHIPLSEDTKTNLTANVGGETRTLSFATNIVWQDGAVAAKAYSVRAATTPELADAGDFERDQAFTCAAWVKAHENRDGAIFARMDDGKDFRGWDLWLEKGRPGMHIIHKWPEDALKVVARQELPGKQWAHVCVTYDGSSKAGGVKVYIDGEVQELEVQADSLKNTIRTEVPFKIGQRHKASPVEKTGVQDLRLYGRALSTDEVRELGNAARMAWLASKPNEKGRSAEDSEELFTRWLTSTDKESQEVKTALARVKAAEDQIRSRGTIAHVMNERTNVPEAHVLFRGEYEKRRDKVEPATPSALPPMPADFPRSRLGFAQWLMRPEHPLTARVTVNRFWQQFFGTGLVKTPNDFGAQGMPPSHPELLDWLAVNFREQGWDVKRFVKMLVMSATYRQDSKATPKLLGADPENLLYGRGPRFRLDAEVIRDTALYVSGLLVPTMGGKGVRPYQPDNIWEPVAYSGSNTKTYKRDTGDALYRRSLYTFYKRTAPPPSMTTFDAPSREQFCVRRERSNTPLQALNLLNDIQYVEAARAFGQRMIKEGGATVGDRMAWAFRFVTSRAPTKAEQEVLYDTYFSQLVRYKGSTDAAKKLVTFGDSKPDAALDPAELAAYTLVANMILNLDEAVTKN